MCAYMPPSTLEVRGQLAGDSSLLPPMSPGDQTRVTGLGTKHLHLLSRLISTALILTAVLLNYNEVCYLNIAPFLFFGPKSQIENNLIN